MRFLKDVMAVGGRCPTKKTVGEVMTSLYL